MEDGGEEVVTDDGCRLWAGAVGQGEPLILCHGGPGLWDMFEELADMLAPRLRVIRWDQRGCGRSERRGPYSMARTVADLDAVRRHFGVERAVVSGHSWGAQVALRYTLDNPGAVSRLWYVSGTGLGQEWHAAYRQNFLARMGSRLARWGELESLDGRTDAEDREHAVLQWSADFASVERGLEYAERMATPWFGINYACNRAINAADELGWREADLVVACRELTVPTLIVEGERDIRPCVAMDSLHQALPNVTRVTLRNTGHVPWLESPDEFRSALVEHLRT